MELAKLLELSLRTAWYGQLSGNLPDCHKLVDACIIAAIQ